MFLLAMLGCFIGAIADDIVVVLPPSEIEVTREMALEAAKRAFGEGGEYFVHRDYYMIEDNDSVQWSLFVDPSPGCGWEHESYIATVPKVANRKVFLLSPAALTSVNCPPDCDMTMMASHVALRFDTDQKPTVAYGALSQEEQRAAIRTYAVILNGGINKNANHERNWNDCSFIYQTLVKKLGVPKDHIFVLMADGTDPSVDMRKYDESYASTPLDLDFDGLPDVQYAATLDNLRSVFSGLEPLMDVDDHLFFFVAGAGSTLNDANQTSFVNLWGEGKLSSFTLLQMINPLLKKQVTFNVVFGQSYGGGLVKGLSESGCVAMSATDAASCAVGASMLPYSSFLHKWTSAINRADSQGKAVDSDLNNDGCVTMYEAFQYAKGSDTISQYFSSPDYLGRELSFGDLAETTNLYIKDNYEDTGVEPNGNAGCYWDSPSIWVRNQDDGIEKHEPVSYAANGANAYVYVKIHNNGKEVVGGTNRYLDVYWAFASTVVTNDTWLGNEFYTGYTTGGYVGRADIGAIAPGDSSVVKVEWELPKNPYRLTENLQFCIGAKMDGKTAPALSLSAFTNQRPFIEPIGQRCHAVKSVSVVTPTNSLNGEITFVRNRGWTNQAYSLSLRPRTARDASLLSIASVEIVFDPVLFEIWKQGGRKTTGIREIVSSAGRPSTFRIISKNNSIDGVAFNNNQVGALKFIIRDPITGNTPPAYAYDLIQRDSENNIVGATAFISQSAPAAATNELAAAGIDCEMQNIDVCQSIHRISTSGNLLHVELSEPAAADVSLEVSSVLGGGEAVVASVMPGDVEADIFVGMLKPGVYALTCRVGGRVVDVVKFTKR